MNVNIDNSFDSIKMKPSQFLILWFAILIFVGATLLNLPFASEGGNSIGFIDALFTAASSVCVTGLIVVNTAAHWTLFGKIVILLLIQIGGLGIMTMATLIAMLLGKRITLKDRLLMREELNTNALQGIVKLTRRIILITISIEAIGALFLSIVFIRDFGVSKGIWFSIFHAVSAFCNAGFDIIGNSMVNYVNNPIINIVIISLVIIGGIGFYVLWDLIQNKKFKKLSLHSKLVLVITGVLLASGFVLVFILEYTNPNTLGNLSFGGKILASLFQSMTPRTAGFNTVDMASLRMSTAFILIVLMFIGGSSGSTAGGVKTSTIGIIFICIYSVIKGKKDIEIDMQRIPYILVFRAIAVVGIALLLVMAVTVVLTITEVSAGFNFIDILFEAMSAFGTVGLSRGITPYLSTLGRLIITFTMFIGRIGPLTIAFAIAQRQKENKGYYRYPEGKILVG